MTSVPQPVDAGRISFRLLTGKSESADIQYPDRSGELAQKGQSIARDTILIG